MKRRHWLMGTCALLGSAAFGFGYWSKRWEYIVIHHSGGNYGNIDFLQQVHRERQPQDPIDAIPYHFIIGNGNGLPMGSVSSDWRRNKHIWGSHVSGRNWSHNWKGLGICLIGNFELQAVPPEQYASLVKLTRRLMYEYNIPPENVNGHGHIRGESTLCPGKHFPMQQFIGDISES